MRFNQSDISEDILEDLRQNGGDNTERCVGTAKDASFLQQADTTDWGDGLIYREAYTAAEAVGRLPAGG
jgi:hypothetical protein